MIIEGIRTFIMTCPHLKDLYPFGIDYLRQDPGYTVDPVPSDPILEEDIIGNSIRQQLFVFASREKFGQDTLKNIENCEFYENFESWLEAQTKAGNFPSIGTNRTPTSIRAIGRAYVQEADDNTARYQIQCQLIYNEKGV